MFFRPYDPTASKFHSSFFSLQVPSGSQRLPARTCFEVLPVCPGAFLIFQMLSYGLFHDFHADSSFGVLCSF